MSAPPPARAAHIAVALATVYVVWGSTYLAIRWMVTEAPPFLAGGSRLAVAGLGFIALARALGAPAIERADVRRAALVGTILLGVSNGLVALAARTVPSGLIALLIATMPLWMVGLDWAGPGGVRPRAGVLAGMLLGFAGAGLLVWRPHAGGAPVAPLGVALVLLASAVWAGGSLLARRGPRPRHWMTAAGLEMLAGGLAQLAASVALGDLAWLGSSQPSARAIASWVYLIFIGSWAGYGAFSWLVRRAPPALASTYGYVNPLVAVLLGVSLGGESFGPRVLLGGLLVLASVVLVTLSERRS